MARRINMIITIGASPINAATGTVNAPAAGSAPLYVSEYLVQALPGGSAGVVKVYDGVPISRAVDTTNDLTVELGPAGATTPSTPFEMWDKSLDRGGIDLNEIWIHGAHSTDTVAFSYVPKI